MSAADEMAVGLQPDDPDVQLRFAVQPDDRADTVEATVDDHVECATGNALLRRLEQQAHRTGQLVAMVGEVERCAEHDRGVDVVSAGVGDAGVPAGVGHRLLVLHRQGVEVRPERECRPLRPVIGWVDVADEPGADGESPGLQTGEEESLLDQFGRGVLGAAEFGVSVQVAA